MLDFKIDSFYTEKLTLFKYFNKHENIHINVNVKGAFKDIDYEKNTLIFKVYYDVESEECPVSFNWIGNFKLIFNDPIDQKIQVIDVFNNYEIIKILDDFINQISLTLINDLPTFSYIMENNE